MRFDKLEFNQDPSRSRKKDSPSLPRRDESHWLQVADRSRREGHYENALRHFSRALELDKSLVVAWVGQVQMLVHLGEYPQAELWSRKALELFPAHGDLMASQAQAMCRMGDMKQAHSLCDGGLRQRGESAYRWQVRGEIMVAGKQEMDQHCFDKAQQTSNDWLVPLETTLIYLHYRMASRAMGRIRVALERAPEAFYAWYTQGVCQQILGFDGPARSSFQRCLELCPRHADALGRLNELGRSRWSPVGVVRRVMGRRSNR